MPLCNARLTLSVQQFIDIRGALLVKPIRCLGKLLISIRIVYELQSCCNRQVIVLNQELCHAAYGVGYQEIGLLLLAHRLT